MSIVSDQQTFWDKCAGKWLYYTSSTLSNFAAIAASSIAVYLFFVKRKEITSVLKMLLNYSQRITFTELISKIDQLNAFNADNVSTKGEVLGILHEIQGQIDGSKFLQESLAPQLKKINGFISDASSLSDPRKRSLVAEMRECIRQLDLSNYKQLNEKQ